MSETYVICDKCNQLNRVRLGTKKEPICGKCQANLPVHEAIVKGSDKNLQALIEKSPLPVVVDVWAPWCGPCKSFAPTFEQASTQYAGKVVFVKLNSDENQQMAGRFGIKGIPTTIVFKNGKEATRQSGVIPREQFGPWLDYSTK